MLPTVPRATARIDPRSPADSRGQAAQSYTRSAANEIEDYQTQKQYALQSRHRVFWCYD